MVFLLNEFGKMTVSNDTIATSPKLIFDGLVYLWWAAVPGATINFDEFGDWGECLICERGEFGVCPLNKGIGLDVFLHHSSCSCYYLVGDDVVQGLKSAFTQKRCYGARDESSSNTADGGMVEWCNLCLEMFPMPVNYFNAVDKYWYKPAIDDLKLCLA